MTDNPQAEPVNPCTRGASFCGQHGYECPQAETTLVEGPQTVSHNANELRRKLATAERIRENADFHLGQEMARRQLAEKETARLRAELAALSTPADRSASTASLAAGLPLVQGRCPACQRASLFLGSGGYVTCSSADCPEPDAATTVLEGDANWPAVRAALLAEAIARVEDPEERAKTTTGLGLGWESARDVLRRMADEAQQPCPGFETQPNRCSCDCEGCRHNCATHQPAAVSQPGKEA